MNPLFPPMPQFERPFEKVPVPVHQPFESREKYIGKKIKQAFLISLLFVVFVNSFVIVDKVAFVFTQTEFDFVTEDTLRPTVKGYFVTCAIVFIITLWIIWS
jgi:hypothetical protein